MEIPRNEPYLLACTRIEKEVPPLCPSVTDKCKRCGCKVWLAFNTLEVLRGRKLSLSLAHIYCLECIEGIGQKGGIRSLHMFPEQLDFIRKSVN